MLNFVNFSLIFLHILIIFTSDVASAENENKNNRYPFIQIGSKYYFINATLKMNWFAATEYCRSYGGDLAHIESPEEFQALEKYFLDRDKESYFWIDGNDLASEGKFMSHTTGRPLIYTKWYNGNPDNFNNEDCVEVTVYHQKALYMNDNQCERERQAICQYREPTMHESVKFAVPLNQNENCMLRILAEAFAQAADNCNSCTQHTLQPTS
ncbi:C-type lectin 37Db [Zeugodacus cucurbitae]|nr:C-type lectin 37Db [Zeugodacus cucurbitae]